MRRFAESMDEYKRLGFPVETVYEDWAMMRDGKASASLFAARIETPAAHRTCASKLSKSSQKRPKKKSPAKRTPRPHRFLLHQRSGRQRGRT